MLTSNLRMNSGEIFDKKKNTLAKSPKKTLVDKSSSKMIRFRDIVEKTTYENKGDFWEGNKNNSNNSWDSDNGEK